MNSMTVFIGENGSGKSTLLDTLAGIQSRVKGELLFKGNPLAAKSPPQLARSISSLGQSDLNITDLPVWMRVAQGFIPHEGTAFVPNAAHRAAITAIAEELKFSHCLNRRLGQLSGGERRRVNIARALIDARQEVIVLDEPFANLDVGHQPVVVDALLRRHQAGQSVVCAIQQLHLVPSLGGNVVGLRCGRTVTQGSAAEVLNERYLFETGRKGRLVERRRL